MADELCMAAEDELCIAAEELLASAEEDDVMAVLETLALLALTLVTFFLTTTSRSTSATSRLRDSAAAANTRCWDLKKHQYFVTR